MFQHDLFIFIQFKSVMFNLRIKKLKRGNKIQYKANLYANVDLRKYLLLAVWLQQC